MQVYYYTRTGRSEEIARVLAERHSTRARKISDEMSWSGAGGFLKGGAMSKQKKLVPAEYEAPDTGNDIILVFPIWAGTFPPAVRTFLQEVDKAKVTAVSTSLGTSFSEREGFKAVYELKGKTISAADLPL